MVVEIVLGYLTSLDNVSSKLQEEIFRLESKERLGVS